MTLNFAGLGQASPRWRLRPSGFGQGPRPVRPVEGEGDQERKAGDVLDAGLLRPGVRDRRGTGGEPVGSLERPVRQQLADGDPGYRGACAEPISISIISRHPPCFERFRLFNESARLAT